MAQPEGAVTDEPAESSSEPADSDSTESQSSEIEAETSTSQAAERSTIAFPYNPLKDAEAIAREIHDKWGTETSPDNLARGMDASPRSGAFRNKLAAARLFGVIESSRGRITLTSLGTRMVDPSRSRQARVEAFFNVPLFERLHQIHSGALLPQNQALENEIKQLGVLPKQAERARWTFQKSAEYAGFFEKEANRLIRPTGLGDSQVDEEASDRNGQHEPELPPRPLTASTLPAPVEQAVLAMLRDGASWKPERTHDYVDALRKMQRALTG